VLGCAFFIQRAYPDELRILDQSASPIEQAAPVSKPDQPKELTELEAAERKLAALVGKPKGEQAAK